MPAGRTTLVDCLAGEDASLREEEVERVEGEGEEERVAGATTSASLCSPVASPPAETLSGEEEARSPCISARAERASRVDAVEEKAETSERRWYEVEEASMRSRCKRRRSKVGGKKKLDLLSFFDFP